MSAYIQSINQFNPARLYTDTQMDKDSKQAKRDNWQIYATEIDKAQ